MKRTPSAISNRLNLIYRGVLPGINPADFAEEKNHSRNEITAHDWGEKGQLGVVNSVSRFVIENEFFQASSFTNDKGETGVCIESKSGVDRFRKHVARCISFLASHSQFEPILAIDSTW